jgi:hypothetical protein
MTSTINSSYLMLPPWVWLCRNVAYYGKIADLHVNDSTYLGRELARISRLLKKGDDAMTRQSLDSFTIRRNILNRVLALISNNNEPSEDGGDL